MKRVQQFLVEAKGAAALQHPNNLAIHQVGKHEGSHYISLNYVEGRDLAKILRETVLLAKEKRRAMAEFTVVRVFACCSFKSVETLIKRPSAGRIDD